MKNKILSLLFLKVFVLSPIFGQVHNHSSSGAKLKWGDDGNEEIYIYVHGSNSSGLASSSVRSLASSSAKEWTDHGSISVKTFSGNGTKDNFQNDISFSSSPSFSSGVVAMTSISYVASTGQIYEADITINDSFSFSSASGSTDNDDYSTIYLGDVLTHEMGHLFGLGHGHAAGSSMIYTLGNGQHSTSVSDQNGFLGMYPGNQDQTKIKGNVIGGDDVVGVFGANVQAISLKTGEVVGSTISGENGDFTISGLDGSDTYYLYVSPASDNADLPSYYQTAAKKFCGTRSYTGSFFSTCSSYDHGFAQGIYASEDTTIDVGNITIKCSLDSPQDYLDAKWDSPRSDYELDISQSDGTYGEAFTGYFTQTDFDSNKADTIEVDLSSLSLPAGEDLYLEVKVVAGSLFSPVRAVLKVNRGDGASSQDPSSGTLDLDSDGNPSLDYIARNELSSTTSDNVFTISLTPYDLIASSESYSYDDFYPAYNDFLETNRFYFMMVNLVSKQSDGSYKTYSVHDYTPVLDNSYCPDAPGTYSVDAFTYSTGNGSSSSSSKKNDLVDTSAGCGTIDLDGGSSGGGSGPLSFVLGLILVTFAQRFKRRFTT